MEKFPERANCRLTVAVTTEFCFTYHHACSNCFHTHNLWYGFWYKCMGHIPSITVFSLLLLSHKLRKESQGSFVTEAKFTALSPMQFLHSEVQCWVPEKQYHMFAKKREKMLEIKMKSTQFITHSLPPPPKKWRKLWLCIKRKRG